MPTKWLVESRTLIYMAGNRPAWTSKSPHWDWIERVILMCGLCVCVCLPACGSVRRKERGGDSRGFFKVGLATNSCMQVCVGVFTKTHALKCVCKCVCLCVCVCAVSFSAFPFTWIWGVRGGVGDCLRFLFLHPLMNVWRHNVSVCEYGSHACEPTVHLSWFQMFFFSLQHGDRESVVVTS